MLSSTFFLSDLHKPQHFSNLGKGERNICPQKKVCPSIHFHIPVARFCQNVLWYTVHSEQQSLSTGGAAEVFSACISWTGHRSGVTLPLAEHPELHLRGGRVSLLSQEIAWVRSKRSAKAILYQTYFIVLDFYNHISFIALSGRRESLTY